MDASEKGQVSTSAAEVYESFFVPALFEGWAERVCDAASLKPGETVLDVGCGTGVLARAALSHVSPGGKVTGLDVNEGMLAVAERGTPDIDWRLGPAEALPFEANTFDAVVSQFGLMFFEDRVAALKEMWRVLRPGGRLAVAVWDSLDRTPGYAAMTDLLKRQFGDEIAKTMLPIFSLGDKGVLSALLEKANIPNAQIRTEDGNARFPSIEAWVFTDIKGWTLADEINDAQYEELLQAALVEMKRFEQSDGTAVFSMPAHIVLATKAQSQ